MVSYNLPRIFKLRDRLFEKACFGLAGVTLTSDGLGVFVRRLLEHLPDVDPNVLWDTLYGLAGVELTEQLLNDTCWRLAANHSKLCDGEPVKPWTGQAEVEWAPVQVLEARFTRLTGRGRTDPELAYVYSSRILAGGACPRVVERMWTVRACKYFARSLGFSAPWGPYPFVSGDEFVGMRFYVELTPERSKDGKPGFDRIRSSSSCVKWNKRLLKMRERDGFKCLLGYKSQDLPCYRCPKGYMTCRAATHPRDYLWAECSTCGKKSWFDIARSEVSCLNCL